MKLSRTERWVLANQYRILEALYPDEAGTFAEHRAALERGYEYHYKFIASDIYDVPDTLSAAKCREVIQVLDMHRALKRSYEALDDKSVIDEASIRFQGYDGNNEPARMAYARYYCESEGGRFTELELGDYNSHAPMVDIYKRMLGAWEKVGKSHNLGRDQLTAILKAKVHPSMRQEF